MNNMSALPRAIPQNIIFWDCDPDKATDQANDFMIKLANIHDNRIPYTTSYYVCEFISSKHIREAGMSYIHMVVSANFDIRNTSSILTQLKGGKV